MTGTFEGLVAIVTGGSSGIGAATAQTLHSQGAKVAILDRQPHESSSLASWLCDITDSAGVDRCVAEIEQRFGGIDILVNNAGVGAVGDIAANGDEEWHRVFDVNVVGIARVTRASLAALRRSGSAVIINTCSVAAVVGIPQRALYSATKGAVCALTLAMAADHLADRIRVNAVLPGTVDTPWVERLLANSENPATAADALRRRQPIGRLVTVDEIAHAIAFLADPRSASTTGALLGVDGGMSTLRLS